MRFVGWWWLAMVGCSGAPGHVASTGEGCDDPGSTEVCEDGSVCTNLPGGDAEVTGDVNQCLPLCEDDDDCSDLEGCRGISGVDLKSCQADDVDD